MPNPIGQDNNTMAHCIKSYQEVHSKAVVSRSLDKTPTEMYPNNLFHPNITGAVRPLFSHSD